MLTLQNRGKIIVHIKYSGMDFGMYYWLLVHGKIKYEIFTLAYLHNNNMFCIFTGYLQDMQKTFFIYRNQYKKE